MSFRRIISAALTVLVMATLFSAFPKNTASAFTSLYSELYYVDKEGGFVYDVEPGTSVSQLEKSFDEPSQTIYVTDKFGAMRDAASRLCTGDVVRCGEERLEVVVKGDLNGDGILSMADIAVISGHLKDACKLVGAPLCAGDFDYSGLVDSGDYAALKKHLTGMLDIYSVRHSLEPRTHTVIFIAGENGSLVGSWHFEGLPHGAVWGDKVTVPEPVPESGYVFDGWSPAIPNGDFVITDDLTYTASFRKEVSAVTRTNYASAENGGTYAYFVGTELSSYKDTPYTAVSSQKYYANSKTNTIEFGNGLLNDGASVSAYDGSWVERAYGNYAGDSDPSQSHVIMFVIKLKGSVKNAERVTVNCGNSTSSSNRGLPDKVTVEYSGKSSFGRNMGWKSFGETNAFEATGGYGHRAAVDAAVADSMRYIRVTLSMKSFYVARIGEIQVLGPEKQTVSRLVRFSAGDGGSLSGPASFTVADGTSWSEIPTPIPVSASGFEFKYWSPTLPAQTSVITADASYTAIFAAPSVVVKNYALSSNGGAYRVTVGSVLPARPDSSSADYGSGSLNDGKLLSEADDPWTEIERETDLISITVRLQLHVNMTRAVINLGMAPGTEGHVLPQSVSVYAGENEEAMRLLGSSYALVPNGGYGYTLTIESEAENVLYVRFDMKMAGEIAQLGETEVYGSLSSAVPTYSVTFTAGSNGALTGETALTVSKGTEWSNISAPVPKADAGYVFDGWTPTLPQTDSEISSDLNFTANFVYDASQWRTVRFETGAGGTLSGVASHTVLSGTSWSTIDVPEPVPESGYVFAGWTPDFPTAVTENVVYTASFEKAPVKTCTVVFKSGEGGTLIGNTSFTLDEGALWSSVTVPTPTADSGFVFVAWSPSLPDSASPISSDLVFTADFAPSGGQTLKGVININGINANQYISDGSHIYTDTYSSYFKAVYWQVFAAVYSVEKRGYTVTEIYNVGDKKSVEVPMGGILVAVHMGAENQPPCAAVKVGDLLVPNANIDIANETFVAGDSYISVYAGDGVEPEPGGGEQPPEPPPVAPGTYTPLNYQKVKAMWLSQYDLNHIYTSGSSQRPESSFRSLMRTVLDNCVSVGVNTVIVQVRPNGDSMYPSRYYTASKYVVGSYGREEKYDPFAIIVEMAHERNLSVQAWINPLRLMTASEIGSVDTKYKVGEWYQSSEYNGKYVVQSGNNFYLNPAYPEVRRLIIDGAAEICTLYNVDGVHMDDYFYPTTSASFDSAAYAEYTGTLTLADWRRENVSKIVKGIYDAVKSVGGNRLYGISPAGNINTVYGSQYADVYRWCSSSGYIDYICPQVYFGMQHKTQGFADCSSRWSEIVTCPYVKLYIGMTLGKAINGYNGTIDQYAGTAEGKYEWVNNRNVLKTCLEYVRDSLPECSGVAYFCYQYFYDPVTGASVVGTEDERANFLPVLRDMW